MQTTGKSGQVQQPQASAFSASPREIFSSVTRDLLVSINIKRQSLTRSRGAAEGDEGAGGVCDDFRCVRLTGKHRVVQDRLFESDFDRMVKALLLGEQS